MKKYRHIYPYECVGCGKRRWSYIYAIRKEGRCTKCRKHQTNINQILLFKPAIPEGQATFGAQL